MQGAQDPMNYDQTQLQQLMRRFRNAGDLHRYLSDSLVSFISILV